jgi:hypothetical protein
VNAHLLPFTCLLALRNKLLASLLLPAILLGRGIDISLDTGNSIILSAKDLANGEDALPPANTTPVSIEKGFSSCATL